MAQAKAITANPTVKAVLEYLNTKVSSSVPTGAICFFATTAIPPGWLLCNGSNVSRTEYAVLFAAIGTKFGAGDGKTTFTLPNLDDRFIEGTTDPAKVGQYLEAGLPNITGFVANIAGDLGGTGPFVNRQNAGTGWGPKDNRGNTRQLFDASVAHYIYGALDTVQPRSLQFLPCIKF